MKIKKDTVYSLFTLLSFAGAALILLSSTRKHTILKLIASYGEQYIGGSFYFLAIPLIFCGLLISRLKFKWNQPGLFLGSFFVWLAATIWFQAGKVGQTLWDNLLMWVEVPTVAQLVLALTFILGLILFFQFSFSDLLFVMAQTATGVIKVLSAAAKRLFGSPRFKFNGKQIKLKGFDNKMTNKAADEMVINETAVKNLRSQDAKAKKNILEEEGRGHGLGLPAQTGIFDMPHKPRLPSLWQYPPLSLLSDVPGQKADRGDVKGNAAIIERTLRSFGITTRVIEVNAAPAVTQYAIEIAEGTKVSKVTSLANDLALALAAPTGQIRIEAPIPGKKLVGIEIPNRGLEFVTLKTMLNSYAMKHHKSKLALALGLDVSGNPIVGDLAKMPHVLIAGATGSGKSVCINAFIGSVLFRASPEEVKMIMVDPKRVELSVYNGIPHLLTPVIVDNKQILSALHWATKEMEERYKKLASAGVKDLEGYNELAGFQAMPYVLIIIDELADIMMFAPVEVEDAVCRIAQMARAVGIHLVLSTQRPSVNVLTGLIKANIPTRISFNVTSMIDSRVIIDLPGAEKLLGRGDMLYIPPEQSKPTRIQGAYVSEREIKNLVDFLKRQVPEVEYTEEITKGEMPKFRMGIGGTRVLDTGRDELFSEVARFVISSPTASVSAIQRKFALGFSRAARIVDQLYEAGIVGPGEKSKPREVLVKDPMMLEQMLNPSDRDVN